MRHGRNRLEDNGFRPRVEGCRTHVGGTIERSPGGSACKRSTARLGDSDLTGKARTYGRISPPPVRNHRWRVVVCREPLMGASNALAAYVKYAGKVPPQSMTVLVYMALVSRDSDEKPWYGAGHEALAQHALGRRAPTTPADLRAVERAVTPLLGDALTVDRRAAVRIDGPNTVRYRLNLLGTAHARRIPSGVEGVEDPPRPTESDAHARRNPSSRPTVSGTHARRIPSDIGDTRNHDELREEADKDLRTDLALLVPTTRIEKPELDPLPPKCCHGLVVSRTGSGESSCALCRRDARLVAAAPNVIHIRRDA